ncbi:MAG: DNA-3-methyladenine glycosylase 2 family protein [Armatimonadetes bacterium]|nr:DNA-3-methyladenine glycosylase 2 family protein [Armatimonadota bacterium]
MKTVPWAKESHRFLSKDELLAKVAIEEGPPTIGLQSDPFAILIESIAGQQLSGKAADAILERVKAAAGDISPERLLASEEALSGSCGLSRAKAGTILALSRAAVDGFDLNHLNGAPDEQVYERLTEFKGIGPWTAEMFMIFGLGRQDVMSPGDLGLRKGLKAAYGLEDVPTIKESGPLFERWRPYRSAACWYLWKIT